MKLAQRLNVPFKTTLYSFFALLILSTLLILSSCTTNRLPLTPITPTPTENSFPGRFVWSDLLTNDLSASQTFYEELFDWTFEKQGNYTVIYNQGRAIAGMVEMKSEIPKNAYWAGYLSVPDIDKAVETVLANNGTILNGPGTMLNRGEYVAIADPQGARLVLLHAASGDPDLQKPTTGDWLWHELWSNDVNASLSFYTNLIGYSTSGVTSSEEDSGKKGDPARYQVLQKDDQWCGGITSLPFPEIVPQWVPAVRVRDLPAIISRVDALGGQILITPSHPLSDGTVALIEDPDGAILMVETWDPDQEAEANK